MTEKNCDQKGCSLLIIILLVSSGLFTIISSNFENSSVEAASTWTETTDADFNNGTMNNLTIEGGAYNGVLTTDSIAPSEWTQKVPPTSPCERYTHSLLTYPDDDKVILFGGKADNYYNNEIWIYDLGDNTWTQKSPNYNPMLERDYALATIFTDDKVVFFGGYLSNDQRNETWIYDISEDTWTNKTQIHRPAPRYAHYMASVFGDDKVVLYGGMNWTTTAYYFYDTWVYDVSDNTWTKMNPAVNPGIRRAHKMTSIYGDDKVLLYGGWNDNDETWIYDLSKNTWSLKTHTTNPGERRYNHGLVSIWGTDKIVLHGGSSAAGNKDDTWIYDISDDKWTEKTPSNRPSQRYSLAFASVYGTDKAVLFGGARGGGYLNDTWVYNHFLPIMNGTYISQPYDTGANSSFITLNWNVITPTNTKIQLQLRSGANISELLSNKFVGPDGDSSTYYSTSPVLIWSGHTGQRWIQYKAGFSIYNYTLERPILRDVTISYNCLPQTIVLDPINGSMSNNNKPTFTWTFEDLDSIEQNAFQVLIDDDIEFQDVNFDSGQQSSTEQFWDFGYGIGHSELPDGKWYWKVRTKDEDDTWTKFCSPRILIIDTEIPNSIPNTPTDEGCYAYLKTISGIAADHPDGSGVKEVEISIRNVRFNHYWNGSAWAPLPTWLKTSTSGTKNWTYNASKVTWSTNNRYSVRSRALDFANNIEVPKIENFFTIDFDMPWSTIITPKNGSCLNNLDIISGDAIDTGGAGIKEIEINIQRVNDKKHWTGDDWGIQEAWLLVIGTDQWSYDSSEISWTTGMQYTILSRAIDHTGNIEVPSSKVSFVYDAQAPGDLAILINNNNEFTNSSSVILSLIAWDQHSSLSEMTFSTDNLKWSPWVSFNNTKGFELPLGDGEKTVYYKVRDLAGNTAEPVFDEIILDTTPPEDLSITINENAKYTNSKLVTLTLDAQDTGSGLSKMSISCDPSNWLHWEPFRHSRIYTLPTIDGEKSIYFRVNDKAGNFAQPVYDMIILDTTPPRVRDILINDGATITNPTDVVLKLDATDEISGVYQISFSSDGNNWSAWESYSELKMYTLPSGDGEKKIYIKVQDIAGNIAEPVVINITLRTPEVVPERTSSEAIDTFSILGLWDILMIIIVIILVIVIIELLILIKRKKRVEKELQLQLPAAITVKPEALPTSTISPDKVPAAPAAPVVPQLPATATLVEISSEQPTGGTTTTPTPLLTESTQVTEPTQSTTPQPQPQPQSSPQTSTHKLPLLPPAKPAEHGPAGQTTDPSPVISQSQATQTTNIPAVITPTQQVSQKPILPVSKEENEIEDNNENSN